MWMTTTPNKDGPNKRTSCPHANNIYFSLFPAQSCSCVKSDKKEKKIQQQKLMKDKNKKKRKDIYLWNTQSHTQTWSEKRVNQDTR